MAQRLPILSLMWIISLVIAGCSGQDKMKNLTRSLNETNIQKLANSYSLAAGGRNNFTPPKSKQELIDFITTAPGIERNLDAMGIDKDSFEDLFISSVDGEEFVVRWGAKVTAMGESVPIVFEKTGIDGIRRVGFANGPVLEADDSTYARLLAGKVSSDEAGPDQREQMEAMDDE